jgi:hypothetical protein
VGFFMGVQMELVKLKITGTVVTSQYGALSAGDILMTSQAFAKHLIDEHQVAEYVKQPEPSDKEPRKSRARKDK